MPNGIVATLAETHEAIEAEGAEERHGNDGIELDIDAGVTPVADIPHKDIEKIEQKDAEGGSYMREAHIDEQMVQVGLVGMEG